jgi:N-acetylated-alpha-linked acidic dipeptidase
VALAELGARMTMRLADAETLPVRFGGFVRAVSGYVDELKKLTDKMRTDTEDRNRSIADGSFTLASDPRVPFVAPSPRRPVPYLNFAPLENAVARLRTSARMFEEQEQRAAAPLPLNTRKQLDQIFIHCDRALLRPEGLPRRPWYKHEIYAPGFYSGYDAKTIPGVREAIEERRWDDANMQIPIVAQTLTVMAEQIDRATAVIR